MSTKQNPPDAPSDKALPIIFAAITSACTAEGTGPEDKLCTATESAIVSTNIPPKTDPPKELHL